MMLCGVCCVLFVVLTMPHSNITYQPSKVNTHDTIIAELHMTPLLLCFT